MTAAVSVLGALVVWSSAASAQRPKRPPARAPRSAARVRHAPRPVPRPVDVLGFEPGTDRKLPTWKQVTDYFAALDRASPRVQVHTLGRTTLGRPFIAAFIADSSVLAHLDRYREIQRRLADPRTQRAGERAQLIADGRVVVLVTSSIHSTEVGGFETPLVLAYRLATGEDADTRAIRATTITILVPSLNPDGVDIVGDWYRSTLGTPWEGSSPPVIYNAYTGHDNNRDWYAFTQVETQLTVDSLHNVWHPQIVNDIHQQGSNASRLFIPPYMDPVEPNVDPLITAGVNRMGTAMAWRLTAAGKTGIAINASYDAWTPARAYQHYHAGIRILTETASARLATPITVPFDSLHPGRGYDSQVSSWNYVAPWPGGAWTLHDIVDYQTSATWALLEEAAKDRAEWLETFARMGERAVAGRAAPGRADWPWGFVIPAEQPSPAALVTMLRILQRGQVEIRRTSAPVTIDGATLPAGSYVVPVAQPYGSFAKALLERQHYPDLREYPGGPPKPPYDVTAQTLPLLMGVHVVTVRDSVEAPLSGVIAPLSAPRLVAPGLSDRTTRRIAIYRSYVPSMDEGWTRWVFDQYRIPYVSIHDGDIRAGGAALRSRFDVILLPDESPRAIALGAPVNLYPDSLTGGLGEEGAAALHEFVQSGGTLVAFNDASVYAVQALALPVRNVLDDVSAREFFAPGSILRLVLDRTHPIAQAMTADPVAWYEDSPAYEVTDTASVRVVASYPEHGDPLLSGWLLGGARLAGKAALLDARVGRGHVILFGFRPQYRAQSMATYPLIWAALRGEHAPTERTP
ncbi:MAG TPA: M14 family zinc carboxypeptidase [Gemmatimonadaceae bacterium]|nr:M14 family zinc carboxypeptidase [Gemmatimonadaceae bacterium]